VGAGVGMFSFDRVPLNHGALVSVVPVLAVAALMATLVRGSRRWWFRTVPAIVAVSGTALGLAAWYVRWHSIIRDHFPRSFLVWIAEILVAGGAAAAGWRQAGRWRRVVAAASVPLTVASAVVLINAHYAYWPTVGDLLGRPLPHRISAAALADVVAGEPVPAAVAARTALRTEATASPSTSPAHSRSTTPGQGASTIAASASPTGESSSGSAREAAASNDSPTAPARPPRPAGVHLSPVPQETTTTTDPNPTMHGVLAPLDIPGTHSGFKARQGTLYLPPAFFASPQPPLPVVVMVGGTPGGPGDWPRAGFAAQTADAYASQHGGFGPILAFVDHNGGPFTDTECVDGPVGHAETFLAEDVPHYLLDTLRVTPDHHRWAIAGFSEGGTCAFELALRHPDVYGAFVDIAGDWAPNLGSQADTLSRLYGGDRAAMAAHDPANLLTANRYHHLPGWFLAGASDRQHVALSERQVAAARAAGITATRTVIGGGHTWQLARAAFRLVLGDLVQQLTAATPSPATSAPPNAAGHGA